MSNDIIQSVPIILICVVGMSASIRTSERVSVDGQLEDVPHFDLGKRRIVVVEGPLPEHDRLFVQLAAPIDRDAIQFRVAEHVVHNVEPRMRSQIDVQRYRLPRY